MSTPEIEAPSAKPSFRDMLIAYDDAVDSRARDATRTAIIAHVTALRTDLASALDRMGVESMQRASAIAKLVEADAECSQLRLRVEEAEHDKKDIEQQAQTVFKIAKEETAAAEARCSELEKALRKRSVHLSQSAPPPSNREKPRKEKP